jgi:hypothetical protein
MEDKTMSKSKLRVQQTNKAKDYKTKAAKSQFSVN